MRREILVSASPQESWVALLEDGQLVEVMFDRPDQGRLIGDIYLGRVDAVIPGIQAAFVDIGAEKAGFLHVSDLDYDDEEDDEENGNGGGRRRKREYPPIQEQVQKGQQILVQVTKEPISTKGPRLTAQVSLPGRFLVYIPGSSHIGISRKIEDRGERSRLRAMMKEIVPAGQAGVIVRTVGEEVTRETLEREYKRLHKNWKKIQSKARSIRRPPAPVHREAKLISGVIRDLFSDKFESLTVDSKDVHNEIVQYVSNVAPELLDRIHLHEGDVPLFDRHGVEQEIQQAFDKKVDLPSGGYIIVEPTEALVSIDVNTGRYTGKKDPERTILKTNLDAAREIAKQLRLRDVGGIIVVDFIDMDSQQNRDRVLHELRSHLGRDRARTRAFEVSGLGLVEMTRQRVRPSLFQALTRRCEHCGGDGRVYTPATVVRRIERSLVRAGAAPDEKRVVIRVHPEVALRVLEEEPKFLERMGRRTGLKLSLRDDPMIREDEFHLLSGPAEADVTSRYVMHEIR
ncbi:MAG: Rne/Rng family ribonuclease [Gemmatimonadales bacterium]|nr:MAG: Rne/Rng family ribonuclease [Gemmatimonadales bacterium]